MLRHLLKTKDIWIMSATCDTHPLYQCLDFLGVNLDKKKLQSFFYKKNESYPALISSLLKKNNIEHSVTLIKDELELSNLAVPCLVNWNLNHFIVVTKVVSDGLIIWDPYIGQRLYRCMEFMEFFRKPGYFNEVISFRSLQFQPKAEDEFDLCKALNYERRDERIVVKWLASIAYFLAKINKHVARNLINGIVFHWDILFKPMIFVGPQRNYHFFLGMENNKSRELARRNIAELALNIGYTNYILNQLKAPLSKGWVDINISLPISEGSDALSDQCIIELLHLFDPVRAVYSVIRKLPAGRNFVVYGNPWSEDMIQLCEDTCKAQGRTLEIIPPANNGSFLKLFKRAKSGSHIIMFADGNPLFSSDESSGVQISRSFGECKLWGRKAFMTATGVMLAKKTGANLYIGGIVQGNDFSLDVKCINSKHNNVAGLMQEKANAVQRLIDCNPYGWIFSRNAEVYFHEYQSIIDVDTP